ncbi:hypothetical protein AB3X91_09060 [Paraburkholderia sp. BR14263]|uniref:hypothetical protein n=1 Tax=unclassified Paraburkholderia TaxID=2615204 RepID=UPI0034CE9259
MAANEPTGTRTPAPVEVKYVVAPGRSVRVDGKSCGPGTPVNLDRAEGERLRAGGFVVRAGTESKGGAGVSVGGLRIQGGRKPGTKLA